MFLAESAFDLENFRKYTPIPLLGICEKGSRPGVSTTCELARAALIAAVPPHSRHVRDLEVRPRSRNLGFELFNSESTICRRVLQSHLVNAQTVFSEPSSC
jgi:hypothetical protein